MRFLQRAIAVLKRAMRINRVFSPARVMVLGFMSIILLGACLLQLPIATNHSERVPFLSALFTATSATCVTGLIVSDTYATWTVFGRVVILCLIQIGGLGFMSIMSIFFFLTSKKIGVSGRLLMVQSLGLSDMKGVVRLVRHALLGTLIMEGIGAVILWIRFAFDFGIWAGLGMGIFHSISAFCNAGFDLMGKAAPYSSLTAYAGDPVVNFTVMALIIIGGMGFFVWEDVLTHRRFKQLHLHTKLVLTISLGLVAAGSVLFFLAERENPATLGGMSTPQALLASLFQSVSPRTAGFNTIDQASLSDASKLLTTLLMFIGGSPGSTAGGIKTVTAGLLIMSAISTVRGKENVSAFQRTIAPRQVIDALALTAISLACCFASSMLVSLAEGAGYIDILYETVSAFGTVGLTTGITPSLTVFSQVIIILLMFFGRVGIMTIVFATILNRDRHEKAKYPDARVMM